MLYCVSLKNKGQIGGCVNHLVSSKVYYLRKMASTPITFIGFRSGVNPLVSYKTGHSGKVVTTLIT